MRVSKTYILYDKEQASQDALKPTALEARRKPVATSNIDMRVSVYQPIYQLYSCNGHRLHRQPLVMYTAQAELQTGR